jgi:hypothetical protein
MQPDRGFISVAELARRLRTTAEALEVAVGVGALPAPTNRGGKRGWPSTQLGAVRAAWRQRSLNRVGRPPLLS